MKGVRAFTLVEMVVALGILTMIIVGLLGIFNQISKALRQSNTQTDVMESGRMLTELWAREIPQASLSGGMVANYNRNFRVDYITNYSQTLPGLPSQTVINNLNRFFFLLRTNQTWVGIGYDVRPTTYGYGQLYRYLSVPTNQNAGALDFGFTSAGWEDKTLNLLVDGVVRMDVRAYDTNGLEYASPMLFTNQHLPAYLEIDLGVLEADTVKKLQARPPTEVLNYLTNSPLSAGRVHLFRQHISIISDSANQ
ncbi:MAG: prepilin-type N-terminal cleavage/methylation domain-containing protein [Verrucomicrobiota bacterium]